MMLRSFFRHYLELPEKEASIACLGGGVGTSQILKGLRTLPVKLTAIVSMADDGGSAGRLRRAFQVPPPGDLVTCLAALSDEESVLKDLFLYRFAGKRYGKDTDLGGQKLGNLIFVALTDIFKGDTNKALEEFSKIVSPKGRVLPATVGDVNIWAKTQNGKKIYGEENIDLGKYDGTRSLSEVHLDPENVKAYKHSVDAIKNADLIIIGPGDLFTTILPVLLVPQINSEIKKSKALKVFIVNIANKPFETANYKVSNFISMLEKHLSGIYFDRIIINTNQKPTIPKDLDYEYVKYDPKNLSKYSHLIKEGDFISVEYPLYHDSEKIAKYITSLI